MASEKLGYVEILADLEAKKAAIEAAINGIRSALNLGALGQAGDNDFSGVGFSGGSSLNGGSVDLPKGALLGKSLPAAIKIYLASVKRKQTTREITNALKEAGVESTSGNFENIVTGALHRLKAAGDVLRFKDGWGLAEFYPENLRARLSQDSKPKVKKAATKPAKSTRPRKGARGRKADGPTVDDQILKILNEGPNSPAALAARTGMASNVVGLALGRLTFKGRVTKLASGNYERKEKTDAEPVLRAV